MESLLKVAPIGLLFALCVKTIAKGAGLSEAAMVIALAALVYLLEQKEYSDRAIKIQSELDELRKEVQKTREEFAEARTYVSGMKLASQNGVRR